MSQKLKFITNYNTSLYHSVDKIVPWDDVVSPAFKEYLDERYELNDEDQKILDNLLEERKALGGSAAGFDSEDYQPK